MIAWRDKERDGDDTVWYKKTLKGKKKPLGITFQRVFLAAGENKERRQRATSGLASLSDSVILSFKIDDDDAPPVQVQSLYRTMYRTLRKGKKRGAIY